MNKRIPLIIGLLLAGGGLAWFGLNWFSTRDEYARAFTEKDLARAAKRLGLERPGPPEVVTAKPIPRSHNVRLAIGWLGLPNQAQNLEVADLLTAELSLSKGLELVERQSLDRVLGELSMNLSGIVRAKDAVRVGKLLKAEWFLLGNSIYDGPTNAVVVRVVDAQTGVMQDIGVFGCDGGSPLIATRLAGFVRGCREAGSLSKPHTFLAVGTFHDLSVNSRLGEFPAQLRAQLIGAYQGSGITMLEREHVSALLHEMRLDLAGLTETSAASLPRMQSAFWLVDGTYQSYETSGYEVELKLNIQRILGRQTNVLLRAKTGQPLLTKVKAEIDRALTTPMFATVPTRQSEVNAQLEAGRELLLPVGWVKSMLELYVTAPFGPGQDEPRRRNLEEASRAFETVLLFQPTNREAKLLLAASTLALGHMDEGRQYCREMLDEPVQDKWTIMAQGTLNRSLYGAGPAERERWLQPTSQQDSSRRQQVAEEALFATIARFDAGRMYAASIGMGDFATAFGPDRAAAARRLVELYPRMKEKAPNSAPYLLAAIVMLQVDTNAPVIAEFEQALPGWAEHPEKIPQRIASFWDHLVSVYDWSKERNLPALGAKIMEAKKRAREVTSGGNLTISDQEKVALGFSHKAAGRWQDALKVFESCANRPVEMGSSGPWGRVFTVVLPSREAAECRKHLGLTTPSDPQEFDMGKSLLCLHASHRSEIEFHLKQVGAIAVTADALWIGLGGKLMRLDANLRTNLAIALPMDDFTPITSMSVTPSNIWLGTYGEGLIGCDPATHKCVQFTVKDGLLMEFIMSLQVIGDALWIGYGGSYGAPSGGGLGRLDLNTCKLTSFTASLGTAQAVAPPDRYNAKGTRPSYIGIDQEAEQKPPRVPVTAIAAGAGGDVWFIARNALRRYRSEADVWEPRALFRSVEALAFQGEDLLAGLGPELSSDTAFGLRVWRPKEGQWKIFPEVAPLPPRVTALKVAGGDIWVGGHSFVALVDPAHDKVLKFAYVPKRSVEQIELGGGYLWAQCEKHLYKAPLSALR